MIDKIFVDRFYFFALYYSTNLEEVSRSVLIDLFSSKFHESFPEIPNQILKIGEAKMNRKTYWFPKGRAGQRAMFANIKDKIAGYAAVLELKPAETARIILICETFLTVNDFVEQVRATAQGLTDWQNLIYDGDGDLKPGDPAPAAPAFQSVTLPSGAFVGIFDEFKALVEDIKAADGYTEAIGEDLMIVAEERGELNLGDLTAALKNIQPMAGYRISLDGSLQGMKMIRVEYWAKGAGTPQTDKFDKLPAVMTVSPKTAGEPETGHLRAYLLKDNQEIGQPSPDYPVTLS